MLKKINSKLEILFEQTPQSMAGADTSLRDTKNNFELINNNELLENLSYVFSEDVTQENLPQLFMQLSSYFEIGFLFKTNPDRPIYKVCHAFVFGKKVNSTENLKQIQLPKSNYFNILKSDSFCFLKHFKMEMFDHDKKMNCYLMAINPNYCLVLLTQTAEPWAKLKIESLQKTLMKINFLI